MSKPEIEKIRDSGVVGAGGAGFPSHIKFDSQVSTLIINGAECEPMIDVDKQLLQNYFSSVYDGMRIAAGLVDAKKIVLALKEKYSQAIGVVEDFKQQKLGSSDFDFDIYRLDDYYPAGDEQVLVYEITGRIVPEGGIPLMVDTVVTNVETLFNVSEAIKGNSVTKKFVSINGEVENPMTLRVPVGTPVMSLIDYCGGTTIEDFKVLDGGPMMGKLIDEEEYAIKKTTKSIVVLPSDSIVIEHKARSINNDVRRAQAICLSCRMCTDLCPRYLLGHEIFPDDMMKKMYRGQLEEKDLKEFDFAYLCCDCGLCELYSCVVDLSPRALFNYIKDNLAEKGIKNTHNKTEIDPNIFRDYRKVPTDRLKNRIEVDKYDKLAALTDFNIHIDTVKLYLVQHVGEPSIPVVSVGDTVKEAQVVADIPEGKPGSKIHSSIDGRVSEITDSYIEIKK